jgi:mannose-1-phosphate guanylyltransferase
VKAILLAGGEGQRLRPLTDHLPKCLVPIRGTPLLAYWLDTLERLGVGEVLVNVSQHVAKAESFLEARGAQSPRVRLVAEPRPFGTAGTVRQQRAFVEGEPHFWIIYSDNLTNMAFAPMLKLHMAHVEPLTLALFRTPHPRSAGIVQLEAGGRIVGFEEKPAEPTSDLANAGIYLARPSLFDWIPDQPGVTDFGHHVLPRLVGKMFGHVVTGYFADIGTPERLAQAEAEWPGF